MKIKEARCTSCGANLQVNDDTNVVKCQYCKNTIVVEQAISLAKVEVDRAKDLKKYRENLKSSIWNNDIDDILRLSGQIKDILPKDFNASYFYGYANQQKNLPKYMYQFLSSDLVYTREDYNIVINHLMMKSDLRDKPRIVNFIKNTESSYLTEYEKIYQEREMAEDNYSAISRDVFVCFSSYNKDIAERVVQELEEDGNTCWISTRNLRPDDSINYWHNIEEAMDNCDIFLLVSSAESMVSKDVRKEVSLANKKQKKLVEFKIDDKAHNSLFKDVFDGVKWVKGSKDVNQDYYPLVRRVYEEKYNKTISGINTTKVKSKSNGKGLPIGIGISLLLVAVFSVWFFVLRTPSIDVVEDIESPVISLKGEETIVLNVGQPYVEPGVDITDDQDTSIQAVIVGDVDVSQPGIYVVTYYATDSAGHQAEAVTRTITVRDNQPPMISLNGQSILRLEVGDTYTELSALVTDNYDASVSLNIRGSVNTSAIGTYEITYDAIDSSGNEATTVTRTVIVEDTTAPTISLYGNSAYYQNINTTFTDPGVNVADNYDSNPTLTITGEVDTSVEGIYTITYQAIDSEGNESSVLTRTIEVIDFLENDNEAPVISLNGVSYIELEYGDTYTELSAQVSDNYSQDLEVSIEGSIDVNTLGTYVLTYRVTDEAGNEASPVTRTVVVQDTTAPVMSLNGEESIQVSIGSSYDDAGVTVSDNYSTLENIIVTVSGTVDENTEGHYTITYQATDSSGNVSNILTRTVEVYDDQEGPAITLHGDSHILIEAGSPYEELGATVEDNYSMDLDLEISGSVDTTILGTYTIQYSASDQAGNTSEVTRTIEVVDTTSPTLSINGPETIRIAIGSIYTDDGVTISDNYDALEDITIHVTGTVDVNIEGLYTITYQATDSSGNVSDILTRTVEVKDFIADFTWLLKSDGTYEVTGYVGNDSSVSIPSQVEGIDVTSIGVDAFRELNITSVYIPSTIQEIKEYAFAYNENLVSVSFEDNSSISIIGNFAFSKSYISLFEFPEGLEQIGYCVLDRAKLTSINIPKSLLEVKSSSFCNMNSLESIVVDDDHPNYLSINGVLFDKDITTLLIYPKNRIDVNYIIPETVTVIGDRAFSGAYNLQELIIPEGVLSIGQTAFWSTGILEFNLPSTLTEIGTQAFTYSRVTDIYVHEDNLYFISIDGVLFSKDKTQLIAYPSGNSRVVYEIPYGTEVVGKYAFDAVGNLEEIVLPRTLISIEESAFGHMYNIKKMYIPNTVINVGRDIFWRTFEYDNDPQIYVEATSKPIGWNEDWNYSGYSITWGATYTSNPYYTFNLLSNGTYEVTGYIGTSNILDIPSLHNGMPVTSIGAYAFIDLNISTVKIPFTVQIIKERAFFRIQSLVNVQFSDSAQLEIIEKDAFYSTGITELVLPESIIEIDYGAFYDTNIDEVFLPGSLSILGKNVFFGDSLSNIFVSSDNPNYSSLHGVLFNKNQTILLQYPSGKEETTYIIPSTVITIDSFAFQYSNLQIVLIQEGVEEIGYGAFFASELVDVSLPSSVSNIDANAFGAVFNLTAIKVSQQNTFYRTIDGVLFNNDLTELLAYPSGKIGSIYDIPFGTKVIGEAAFRYVLNLTEINIPRSVERINRNAFQELVNVTEIFIPNSVVIIDGPIFGGSDIIQISVEATSKPSGWSEDWNMNNSGVVFPVTWGVDYPENTNYMFELQEDNTYEIIRYIGSEDYIEIPNMYSGLVVSKIGDQAFEGTSFKGVLIPNSILSIGADAFSNLQGVDVKIYTEFVSQPVDWDINWNPMNVEVFWEYLGSFSADFILVLTDDNTYEISDYIGDAETVIIPEEYNEIPITSINQSAFVHSDAKYVHISKNILEIHNNPFLYSHSMIEIIVDEQNPNYMSDEGVLFNKDQSILIHYPAEKLGQTYTIPSSVEILMQASFNNADYLDELVISEGVTTIEASVFGNMDIQSITLPSTVHTVNWGAGFTNSGIEHIYVNENSEYFQSINGVLFTADGLTLVAYPGGKQDIIYNIPEGTEIIGYASIRSYFLEELYFPNTLSKIENNAIQIIYNVSSIVIPISVEIVEYNAFSNIGECVIYVEAPFKPDEWSDDWANEGITVIWNYTSN